MNPIIKHHSIIAIAGPEFLVKQHRILLLNSPTEQWSKVLAFGHPDDYGEYPDTMGYTEENWEEKVSEVEDDALYPYMTKCMDACLSYVNKKYKKCCKMYPGTVRKSLAWPRWGCEIFVVGGNVTVEAIETQLLH